MKAAGTLQEVLASISEWQDDQTCQSLFSSFIQPRNINPEAYDSRLSFWIELITKATRLGLLTDTQSVFSTGTSQHLSFKFQRKGIAPLGLAHVMVFTY